MDPPELVAAAGGFSTGAQLRSAGVSRATLTALVASGVLRRPRRGWYSTLSPGHPQYRAVRIGGRLTGASALFEMGAWMWSPPPLIEVAVPRGSTRLRRDLGAVVRWEPHGSEPESASLVGLTDSLTRVILDCDLEVAVPCIDWAFCAGRLDATRFGRLLDQLPERSRVIREWVDPASQSLLESVARVRLMRAGWPVRSQVAVHGFGPIDLVIADKVALELDGRESHERRFEADRRKDLQITLEGRHAMRASYGMVRDEWDRIERAIRLLVGRHNSVTTPQEPRGVRRARSREDHNDGVAPGIPRGFTG